MALIEITSNEAASLFDRLDDWYTATAHPAATGAGGESATADTRTPDVHAERHP